MTTKTFMKLSGVILCNA